MGNEFKKAIEKKEAEKSALFQNSTPSNDRNLSEDRQNLDQSQTITDENTLQTPADNQVFEIPKKTFAQGYAQRRASYKNNPLIRTQGDWTGAGATITNSPSAASSQDEDSQLSQDDLEECNEPIQSKGKTTKPPPIYCDNVNIKQLNIILSSLNNIDFHMKDLSNNNISIFTNSMTNFESIKKQLEIKNILYYTYTPRNKKNKITVLKGLNGNYSSEEVSENLSSLQIEGVNILKVEMINFSKNAELDPSYIVTLSPDSLIKNLTRRKKILHQIVYWEPLRKNQIFQCK